MPGARTAQLNIKVTADTSQAAGDVGKATSKFDKFGSAVSKMALPATAALGALGALGAGAVSAASDMNETLNKSQTIFGSSAGAIVAWSQSAASSFGLSQQAALDAASGFGDMFSQLGFTSSQAAGMSQSVVGLAADLGSFSNLDTGEVLDMLSGAFRGEYDSLQRVIPNINAARVESEALAETGKKTAKELTAQEKAHATLAIVQKDGARAAGDFAKTSDGLANSQKILTANWQDAQAKLGTALLPAVTSVVEKFAGLATWMSENSTLVSIVAGVVAVLAGAILVLNVAMTAATAVTWALNAAFLANPITWIIIAIVALVAAVVILWVKCEGFRNAVTSVWNAVKNAVSTAVTAIGGFLATMGAWISALPGKIGGWLSSVGRVISAPFIAGFNIVKGWVIQAALWFDGVVAAIGSALSGVTQAITAPFAAAFSWIQSNVIGPLKSAWNTVASAVNGWGGFSVAIPDFVPVIGGKSWDFRPPRLPYLAAGAWVTGPTVAMVGEGRHAELVAPEPMLRRLLREEAGGITININGGLDSADAIARRVQQVLTSRDRRTGPVILPRRAAGAVG